MRAILLGHGLLGLAVLGVALSLLTVPATAQELSAAELAEILRKDRESSELIPLEKPVIEEPQLDDNTLSRLLALPRKPDASRRRTFSFGEGGYSASTSRSDASRKTRTVRPGQKKPPPQGAVEKPAPPAAADSGSPWLWVIGTAAAACLFFVFLRRRFLARRLAEPLARPRPPTDSGSTSAPAAPWAPRH